jgi:hypothetical protein
VAKHLREKGFILAHSFRSFRPQSLGSVASGHMYGDAEHRGREEHVAGSVAQLMVDRRQREAKHPPARLHSS